MIDTPRLIMSSIHKSFSGVEVLHGVDFDLVSGEAHALLGENGAGKSTLMKILSGVYQSDGGRISIEGREHVSRTTHAADAAGIAIIHQELSYVPRLSVAENLLLGHLPRSGPGVVQWRSIFEDAQQALEAFGTSIDARSPMGDLPLGQRQIVEIVRAVHRRARIIIMDEPTASLTDAEVQRLFVIVRALKKQGVSIVYISHHLEEVFEIADRVTVLRDGRNVVTRRTADCTRQELIQDMVGRDVTDLYHRADSRGDAVLLDISHLTVASRVRDVSFSLRRGEVLGLYGLAGAGQETVSRALFGLEPAATGTIAIEGRARRFSTPAQAIAAGIGCVPSDRKVEGLVLGMSVKGNLTLPLLDRISRLGVLAGRGESRLARAIAHDVGVRAAGLGQQVMYLSGGNQQKVVLGRWLKRGVKLLLLNEPTRGVDVGAKAEIYESIRALARGGAGILVVSSDLPEVLSITDRVAVLVRGQLAAIVDSRRSSQQEILQYATVKGGGRHGTQD